MVPQAIPVCTVGVVNNMGDMGLPLITPLDGDQSIFQKCALDEMHLCPSASAAGM